MREIVTKATIVLVAVLAAIPATTPAVAQPSSSEDHFETSWPRSPSLVVAELSLPGLRGGDNVHVPSRSVASVRSATDTHRTLDTYRTPATATGWLWLATWACLAQVPPSVAEHMFQSAQAGEQTSPTPHMQEEDSDGTNITCTGDEVTVTITSGSIRACVTDGECNGEIGGQGVDVKSEGTVCVTVELTRS